MKRVSQLTALAMLCGLASFSSLAADMPHAMTLSQLQAQHGAVIDTRAQRVLQRLAANAERALRA